MRNASELTLCWRKRTRFSALQGVPMLMLLMLLMAMIMMIMMILLLLRLL
jgi:hypothetical protein